MSTLLMRTIQLTELTEEEREAGDESNPILFAESGPNRFATMSLFFSDIDGVRIQEDLDVQEITVYYFDREGERELTEGIVYDWAYNFYKENWAN